MQLSATRASLCYKCVTTITIQRGAHAFFSCRDLIYCTLKRAYCTKKLFHNKTNFNSSSLILAVSEWSSSLTFPSAVSLSERPGWSSHFFIFCTTVHTIQYFVCYKF